MRGLILPASGVSGFEWSWAERKSRNTLLLVLGLALATLNLPAGAATGRAVSLNAVATAARTGHGSEVERLCGITQVVGYLADDATRDVILIGRVDPSRAPLYLDDFAVALRNVRLTYARVQGRTRYYSPPGCSIDPDPNVLRQLQLVGIRMRADSEAGAESALDEWAQIGRRPQNVRVMGVPFDSRFAGVMVDADYYMKRLTNGSVKLDIPGFLSLSEMTANSVRKELVEGRESSMPAHTLNRFWFSPGESTYEEEGGVTKLKSCRVKLLTEEEFLTEHGRVAGLGRPSPLAARFAQDFSSHYDQIAAARPIYADLEGLFRFVAVARLLKESGASSAGLVYLLRSHKVRTVPVNRQVLGLTNVTRVEESIQAGSGTTTVGVILQSCGGVSMDVRPRRVGHAVKGAAKQTAKRPSSAAARRAPSGLKKTVLSARGTPGALSWDFPLDPGSH